MTEYIHTHNFAGIAWPQDEKDYSDEVDPIQELEADEDTLADKTMEIPLD